MQLKTEDLIPNEPPHLPKGGGKKQLLQSLGSSSSLDLKHIVATLRKTGSADGFRELRDLLLERFPEVKREFGAVNVINLAINCDKHSMLADIAASKVREKEDHSKYDALQEYLSGRAPLFTVTTQAEEEVEYGTDQEEDNGGDLASPEAGDPNDDGESVD